MLSSKNVGVSLACTALVVVGCGRDEADTSTRQDGLDIVHHYYPSPPGDRVHEPPLSAEGSPRVDDPSHIVLSSTFVPQRPTVRNGPPPSPFVPPAPVREVLLLEWQLSKGFMEELVGERLVYRDPQTGEVFRGSLEHEGLLLSEILSLPDGFVPLPLGSEFVLQVRRSNYPMTFWAEGRGAVVEVQDCEIDIATSTFTCVPNPESDVAFYTLQVLGPADQWPSALWCVDGCPDPLAPAEHPYFARHSSFVAVPDQAVEYRFEGGDGLLYFDEQAVLPQQGEGIATGPLFAPTEENIKALSCDLDEDGDLAETCTWELLDVFYTYSVDAEHILPFRGPGVVGPGITQP